MTVENPWLTGGSNPEPTDAETDPFRALGFGFSEESPTMSIDHGEPTVGSVAPEPFVSAEPAPWSAAPAPAPGSWQLAAPPAPQSLIAAASAPPAAVAPTSRRALRDAQRIEPTTTGFPGNTVAEQVAPTAGHAVATVGAVSPAVSSPAPSTRRSARAAVSAPPPRPTTTTAPTRPVAAIGVDYVDSQFTAQDFAIATALVGLRYNF